MAPISPRPKPSPGGSTTSSPARRSRSSMAASRITAISSRPSRGVARPRIERISEPTVVSPRDLLDSDIAKSGLPGAPTVARAGRRLGLRTVRDLLFHLPRRYDDLREMHRLGDLTWTPDGEAVSARVRVAEIHVEPTF